VTHLIFPSFRAIKGDLKMTTIGFPISTSITPRSATANLDSSISKSGFGILMLWAFAMLSVGAFAHFGAHSYELSAFELLALQ
jgi:hypothetical protein